MGQFDLVRNIINDWIKQNKLEYTYEIHYEEPARVWNIYTVHFLSAHLYYSTEVITIIKKQNSKVIIYCNHAWIFMWKGIILTSYQVK